MLKIHSTIVVLPLEDIVDSSRGTLLVVVTKGLATLPRRVSRASDGQDAVHARTAPARVSVLSNN